MADNRPQIIQTESSSTGLVVGLLIVLIVAIVGFIAYRQGFFTGVATAPEGSSIEINLPESSSGGSTQ